MVPAVLWCLLPRSDSPSRTRSREKHQKTPAHDRPPDPPSSDRHTDPPDSLHARATTPPPDSFSYPLIPDGGIGESPSPVRPKRSSFTTFFAFSSKRKLNPEPPVVRLQHTIPGKWVPDRQVHVINPASIPSPLRADDDEYYYSYYPAATPTFPSNPTSPHPDPTSLSPSKRLSPRHHNPADLDSQLSSPVDSHPSHVHFQHPYAYSAPLETKPSIGTLRHATSQPFQHHPQDSRSDINSRSLHSKTLSSRHVHDLSQSRLKTSLSTPNLASGTARVGSLSRKKPPRSNERWLSAESWWDALFSPSPRFKVQQAPRPHTADATNTRKFVGSPSQGEQRRNLGVGFPSLPALRPRAVSVTSISNTKSPSALYPLSRSRSAADILGQPSTSTATRAVFEPALEPLVDERTPTPDQASSIDIPSPRHPPLSLEQVIDEGEAFKQQRAQWKKQATRSIGNKHTRSFSRARSKSLSERHAHARGHHTSESNKSQFNIEFLAARTLLGSQSTMPTVHVTRPSTSSSHSKAYSHSHSLSAYSYTHTSHSHGYSHSHSHSLTTTNSSKSSRNLPPRGHSRAGSWSKTAFLKAGSLCGVVQDESYGISTDELIPPLRVDVQDANDPGNHTKTTYASEAARAHPHRQVVGGEVGIAITPEGCAGVINVQHPVKDRRSSKHTHQSSEYAGPHPSVVNSSLPQLGAASDVSLRHRLPPRAAIHPPIAPIAHPYRSALDEPKSTDDKAGEEVAQVTGNQADPRQHPHLSLSHTDFGQYGVGEALVYASVLRQEKVLEGTSANTESTSSLISELSPSQEQSPSCETVVLPHGEPDASSLGMDSPPSLTNSTIQMVMSAFDNPDDLDEFQDLFYKPHSISRDRNREPSLNINQVPTDVRSSASNSPLTHLVRQLSEEVHAHSRRDTLRTPSGSIRLKKSEFQDYPSSEVGGTKFVFTDSTRLSSSPMGSSSQLHLPIERGSESNTHPTMIIPEDVNSSCTVSDLESPWGENENDTFGYPIKHGQFGAVASPAPIQSPLRLSTHLSIQENQSEEEDDAFLDPVRKRFGMSLVDATRSSYLTTSDLSRMSELSDFPLPPTAQPSGSTSLLQVPSKPSFGPQGDSENDAGIGRHLYDEVKVDPVGDVGETLEVLRRIPRVSSYGSHRTTFGGSEDMDFIAQVHEAGP